MKLEIIDPFVLRTIFFTLFSVFILFLVDKYIIHLILHLPQLHSIVDQIRHSPIQFWDLF